MTKFSCAAQGLTELPPLPEMVEEIHCNNNRLPFLPELPPNLKRLECGANSLETLPTLPEGIIRITCIRNRLKELPRLPSSLEELNCYDNYLTELPTLPENLLCLACMGNKLTVVPRLPASLEVILLDFNPLIEPFKTWVHENKSGIQGEPLNVFREKVNAYWDEKEKTDSGCQKK